MKKLIVLLVFIVGLLPTITATEYFIVKIGKKLTIYSVTDYGESNYWGRNVVIDKSETIIPSDSYFEGLDIPKNEWDIFSKNQNGIYDSRLEKLDKEKAELRKDYNKLFAEKTDATELINLLEASIGILLLAIIFLGFALIRKTIMYKKCNSKKD